MPWIPVSRVSDLLSKQQQSHSNYICYITASTSCFLCKLVEPKIRSFADDVEYQDIEFYTIDVDVVEDVDGLPETVSTLPTFVLYRGGELQECVAISSDKRPGRSLARAISRVYFTNHGKEEATGA